MKMDPARKRPWYRLHSLTWVIMAAVVGGLVSRQLEKETILGVGGLGMYSLQSSVGWPLQHAEIVDSGEAWLPGSRPIAPPATFSTTYEWFVWPLLANCILSALLVAATAFVCESWLMQERRLQISLRQILILMATLGVLLALTRPWTVGYRDLDRESFKVKWSLVSLSELKNPLHWPAIMALACAIYAAVWLVGLLTLRGWSLIRRLRG